MCSKCAPAKPNTHWIAVTKGTKTTFVPMEDGKEAAVYERALKQRPEPWLVRLSNVGSASGTLTLQIGCNPVSLVQRGLGLLPQDSLARRSFLGSGSSSECSFEWRVVPHQEKIQAVFSKLVFTSNKRDEQAKQPPRFRKFSLRKEQLRSLTWMLRQESTVEPFYEEEVSEAILPTLEWRAEGRVRRPVVARGGIIADEVRSSKRACVELTGRLDLTCFLSDVVYPRLDTARPQSRLV